MSSEITKQSFRTDRDNEQSKRAAEEEAKRVERVTAAKAIVDAAEEACIAEPNDNAFAKAREARRAFEDAERDLSLAKQSAARVESEIRAAECARIKDEIARRESLPRTEFLDDEVKLHAIEIGERSAELLNLIVNRGKQRRAEIEEQNALRARVGLPAHNVPSDTEGRDAALAELVKFAWAAQDGSGWEIGCGCFANPLFIAGVAQPTNLISVVQQFGSEVDRLRSRTVSSQRTEAREKGKNVVGIAAKAAVGALSVLSALTMIGGG